MTFIFFIIVLLISAILHEVSHGVVANALGDSTAKDAGRLTLNPIPHVDFFGSIVLPALLMITGSGVVIAWAKPVPVNPARLRDERWGYAKVSLAGPASNLLLALVFGLALRFLPLHAMPVLSSLLGIVVEVNLWLALFNLVPIPPLDGSHLLFSLLPNSLRVVRMFLQQYWLVLLLVFILFFSYWINVLMRLLFIFIVGTPL